MWRQWLSLTAGEQKGFFILVALCLLLMLGIMVVKCAGPDGSEITIRFVEASPITSNNDDLVEDTLYVNSSTATQMSKFGLSDRFIVNALKYRDAGGRYRSFSDLSKTRGFDSLVFEGRKDLLVFDGGEATTYHKPVFRKTEDRPRYVHLWFSSAEELAGAGVNSRYSDSIMAFRNRYYLTGSVRADSLNMLGMDGFMALIASRVKGDKKSVAAKEKIAIDPFDINSADTAMLARLDGVGNYTALRIVEYRDKLGGFVDLKQLLEIKNISEEIINRNQGVLFVDKSKVITMSVNSMGVEKLRRHPYVSFYLAKEIVERRRIKGNYSDVEQVKGLPSFDKASPFLLQYLTVENK